MKPLLILSFFIITWNCSFSQNNDRDSISRVIAKRIVKEKGIKLSPEFKGSALDKIRIGLLNGDKTDLLKIAPYLDSTRKLTEYLGYHILETEERQIAQRLIIENCIFLNTEIVIDNKITAKSFFTFYKQNEKRIGFSVDAGAFLIAPLKDRSVNFEIQELSETDKNNLKENENVLLNLPWVKKNHIEQLINSKNPYALFKIAAELFKGRNRFDNYQSDAKNYIDLLDLLTGTETGVKNEHQKITLHIDKDYDPASRLNLLIYFAKNSNNFSFTN